MRTYNVAWDCDIAAKNPIDAARQALKYIKDETLNTFTVYIPTDGVEFAKEVEITLNADGSVYNGD